MKKKTTELMATQNMDYNSAKRIVTQGFPGTALRNSNGNGHPQPNNVEFPILTRHKNDAQPSPMHLPTSNYGGTRRIASFSEAAKSNSHVNQNKLSVITEMPSNDIVNLEKILSILLSNSFLKILDKIKQFGSNLDISTGSSGTSSTNII